MPFCLLLLLLHALDGIFALRNKKFITYMAIKYKFYLHSLVLGEYFCKLKPNISFTRDVNSRTERLTVFLNL
jgi:hypothetical protein